MCTNTHIDHSKCFRASSLPVDCGEEVSEADSGWLHIPARIAQASGAFPRKNEMRDASDQVTYVRLISLLAIVGDGYHARRCDSRKGNRQVLKQLTEGLQGVDLNWS